MTYGGHLLGRYDVNAGDSTRPALCAMTNPFGHASDDVTYVL